MALAFSICPTSTPGFIVSSGGSTSWSGIPEDLKAKITEAHGRGERLRAVSVAPDGDWFLNTDERVYCKSGPTSRVQGFIQHFAKNVNVTIGLGDIETFTFGPKPDACVLTVSRQGGGATVCLYRSGAIPHSLDAHLLATLETTEAQSVAMGREDSWVFVGVDGSVKWSGIPASMVTTIKSRASIPIKRIATTGSSSTLTIPSVIRSPKNGAL
ncbi:hypothetical protein HWV62_45765 [Athelia sp. TMB]|nr:hypothetical protein HWV62_45765 [Athelia sp. TMB]